MPAYFENSPLGLYVHVPFCASACDYCAFYHEPPQRARVEAWLNGIARESELVPLPRRAETFFLGGGTPGILSANDFEKLGEILLRANGGIAPSEWSVELAPSAVKPDKLAVLRALGVNRISLGVQSLDAETLEILGRRHAPKKIFEAFDAIRAAGFENVNLDLIFAVPGEKKSRWDADLRTALALAPEHISTYCLMLEPGAPLLARLEKSGNFDAAEKSPEREAELYLHTWSVLESAGYRQYEVANFAKTNSAGAPNVCIHNLNTWKMHEWLGWGPAAASQCGGQRFANVSNLELWLDGLTSGAPARVDCVELDGEMLFADSLIFGLRLNAGVDVPALAKRFLGGAEKIPSALFELEKNLAQAGYLENGTPAGTLALNARGRLVADAVAEAVLDAL